MKKWFKKIITGVAVLAMAICLLPAMNVKAATSVTLYFKLPSGWTAATTGYNYWSNEAHVTGSGNTVIAPTAWDATHNRTIDQVTDATGGWVSVVVNDTSKMEGIQLISAYGAQDCVYNIGTANNSLWNTTIVSLGLTAAYFDTTTNKWYKEQACTNEVLPPTLDDIYYVVGAQGLTGADWKPTAEGGKMTEGSNGNFTKEFTVATAGTYEYKILQDPADFEWNNPYTAESNGSKANGNGSVTTTVAGSTVKFTINKTTKIVTVDVSAPQGSGEAGQGSGEAGQGSGEAGQGSGEAGQGSGEAANTAKIYIYAKTDASWGDEVYLYAWQNGASTNEGAWPGNKMEKMGNGWYRLAITEKSDRVIINNGKDKTQTQDITITAGKSHAFTVAADGKYEASELPKMGDVNAVPYVVALLVGMGVVGVAIARKRRVA